MSDVIERLASALADRYRIERELGAGGMATVYLAEDLRHHRRVAIKVLKPELAAVIGAERFLREIQTVAALQHPHILGLFDSGVAEVERSRSQGVEPSTASTASTASSASSLVYYVMPFVEGESLRDRLTREKQLPIADAVRIATEVASALDYAHRHGVIHRDIKPENILLHDGSALVADFGIALAVSTAGGSTRMTETGMSLGTPHYMSPEQAMGEREIGPRSDVYALGAVTYEMLTGDPPFTGSTAQAIVARVVTENPRPLIAQRATIPAPVEAAVLTALQKLPADRFPGARAFAEALTNPAFQATGVVQHAARERPRSRMMLVALGLAGVMAALAAWGWFRRAPATAANDAPLRVTIALPDTALARGGVAISPDGATVVYSASHDGVSQLYRLQLTTGRLDAIPGTRGARWPTISPNGRQVAYHQDQSIFVLPLENGTPTRVFQGTAWDAWTTWLDDSHLLLDTEAGVLSMPVNGGPPTRMTTLDSSAGATQHLFSSPLPPGDGVIFTVMPSNYQDISRLRIAAVGPRGGKPVILTAGYYAKFVPPDHLVVNRGDGTIAALPFDPRRLRITGPATPIVTGLLAGAFTSAGLFDVAPSGRMVVQTGDDLRSSELVWVDQHGAAAPFANGWSGQFVSVALSPDGSRVAAGFYTSTAEEIRVRDVATGSLARINDPEAQLRNPAWAPDGRTLFYAALALSHSEVRLGAPGAVGAPRTVVRTPPGTSVADPAPSPDGRVLYYRQYESMDTAEVIRAIALTGHDSVSAAIVPSGSAPEPSPDGRWLAYLARNDGAEALMVRSTDTTRAEIWQVARSAESDPHWSRDGSALFFVARDSMQMVTVDAGSDFHVASRRALFPLGSLQPVFDVAPDGRFIMVRRLPDSAFALHLLLLDNWMKTGS